MHAPALVSANWPLDQWWMMCRTTRPAGLRGRGIGIVLCSLRRDRGLFSSLLRARVGSDARPWTFAMHWMHRGIIEQAQSHDRRHLGIAGSGEIAEFLPVWEGIVHAVICVPFHWTRLSRRSPGSRAVVGPRTRQGHRGGWAWYQAATRDSDVLALSAIPLPSADQRPGAVCSQPLQATGPMTIWARRVGLLRVHHRPVCPASVPDAEPLRSIAMAEPSPEPIATRKSHSPLRRPRHAHRGMSSQFPGYARLRY